jgi:hypothetical protein
VGETGRTKVQADARWDDRVATLLDRLDDLLAARGQPKSSKTVDA